METPDILSRYGLFDAKVPRYTSYPPANRFCRDVGRAHQQDWLEQVPAGTPLSLYIHIPFCRRLCWFCACRTQGTQSLRPVEAYVATLCREIERVADHLHPPRRMARLHLGGGTPTLLPPAAMETLLNEIFDRFFPTSDFEFSVEIDPTEASEDVLDTLANWGMSRASIGVQDFEPAVQDAIGRTQSIDQTRRVAMALRQGGVGGLNIDLLYGLPYQTPQTLARTLDQIVELSPDRLALYGYAHVPHVSKRQVMIPSDVLPGPIDRFELAEFAKSRLIQAGFRPIGIDHFAKPDDGLAKAADTGHLRRNFQGYTDDPCDTLIGFGASAISRFPQGYVQNAAATAAYTERINLASLAGHRGHVLSPSDHVIACIVENLMCRGCVDLRNLRREFPAHHAEIRGISRDLATSFPDALRLSTSHIEILPKAASLTRVICGAVDRGKTPMNLHSSAI